MLSGVPKSPTKEENEQSSDTIRIISSDDEVFEIPRSAARHCKLFHSMFNVKSSFKEAVNNEVRLDFNKNLCKVIADFLIYKDIHGNVEDFKFPVEYSIDLYVISDFLGI